MEDRLIVFYNFTDLNSNMDRIQYDQLANECTLHFHLNSNMDRIQYFHNWAIMHGYYEFKFQYG